MEHSNLWNRVSIKIITTRFKTGTIYIFETFWRKIIYGMLLSSAIDLYCWKNFDKINYAYIGLIPYSRYKLSELINTSEI
jgi:hypothetical protein